MNAITVMLGIGTLLILVTVPFSFTGKAALVGLLFLYGYFEAARRRGQTWRATALLAVIAVAAVLKYDPALRSGLVGWVTSEHAQIADPSAYTRKEALTALLAVSEIRGNETHVRLASVQSASATTGTTASMTSTAALDIVEEVVAEDRVFEQRLEQVRQKISGRPAPIVTPPTPPASESHAAASTPPRDNSWRYALVTVTAGKPVPVSANFIHEGWTFAARSAGKWNSVRLRGRDSPAFKVAEVGMDYLTIANEGSGEKKIVVAAPENVPDGQKEEIILVFCPPEYNVMEAFHSPLTEGVNE